MIEEHTHDTEICHVDAQPRGPKLSKWIVAWKDGIPTPPHWVMIKTRRVCIIHYAHTLWINRLLTKHVFLI